MPRLRIFLNLEHFYSDHRKFVKIYLPGHIKLVSDLENYIGKLFDIKEKFILISTDAYVHAAQKVHVFLDSDIVKVVPINQAHVNDSSALEKCAFTESKIEVTHSSIATPASQENILVRNETHNDITENKVKQNSPANVPVHIQSHIVLTPSKYSFVPQISSVPKTVESPKASSVNPKPTNIESDIKIANETPNGTPTYPRKYTRYEFIDFEADVAAKLKFARQTSTNIKSNTENKSQLDLQQSITTDSANYTHNSDSVDEKITSTSSPAITAYPASCRNESRKRKRTRHRKPKIHQVENYNPPVVKNIEERGKERQKHIRFDDLDTDTIECDIDNSNTLEDLGDDTGLFQYYPTLCREPKVGDILAFKKLKLSDDMTPVLSDYIVGTVTHVNQYKIIFKITEGTNQLQHSTASDPDYDETTNLYHCSKTWLKVVKFVGESV